MTQPARAAAVDLHIGFLEAVDSLNLFRGLNDPSFELYGMLYDYLYSFDQDGNLIPNIAVNAITTDKTGLNPDPSGQNWTYWIRQGVIWSDNTPMTADDVAFTINYNIQNFFQLWNYEPYVNRIVQCSSKTLPYCGAVITSPWNVTVYFDRSFVPGKGMFVPIIQKAQWQGLSAAQAQSHFNNPNPIGTGPFIADPYIYTQLTSGYPLVVHKNLKYHPVGNHVGPSRIDNIYFQQFNDENALVGALQAGPAKGGIDLAKLTSYGYKAVAGSANVARQEGLIVTEYWNEIAISQIDTPSADKALNPARWDVSVRRAMAMATNKDYIINTTYLGKGVRGDSLMTLITPQWWYDPTTDPGANLTFDIKAANALLNQSYSTWSGGSFGKGYRQATSAISLTITTNACSCANPTPVTKTVPAGTQLTFTMAVRQEFKQEQDTATYLVLQWAKVGIQLIPKVESETSLSGDVYGGGVETYIWYWSGDPDPNYLLSIESGYTLDGWNDNFWNNVSYNNLYVQQLADTNFAQRQADVRAAQKIHYESAVYIIYIVPYGEWAYRTDSFTGWGDWNAHPFRQMDAFWGANPLFFDLVGTGLVVQNNPPTKPVINPGTTPPLTVVANRSVNFVGTSTDPDVGETLTWTWNWGDGSNPTKHQSSSAVTQDSAAHAWNATGFYNVTLSVFDGQLSNTSNKYEVIVTPATAVGWINGTVKDASTNAPITTASVRTSPGSYGGAVNSTTGAFSIAVPAGTYSVTASAPLYLDQSQTGVSVTAGVTAAVNFALTPYNGWIAGWVNSTAGGSIANVAIYIDGSGGFTTATHTDTNGHYIIGLSPGTYGVRTNVTGFVAQSKTGIAVTLGNTTVVNFQLQPVEQPGPGLSTLLIAGAGIAIAVLAIALAVYFVGRRRKQKEQEAKVELPKK